MICYSLYGVAQLTVSSGRTLEPTYNGRAGWKVAGFRLACYGSKSILAARGRRVLKMTSLLDNLPPVSQ
jgi:hypothetical protein